MNMVEQALAAKVKARSRVEQAARRGDSPRDWFALEELEWAYDGALESELARLDGVAREAREATRLREERATVIALAERIEKEWDEDEKRKRHEKALKEARRRLGLKDS